MCHLSIESLIVNTLQSSRRRLTRLDLQRRLTRRHGVDTGKAKAAIDLLLRRNEIAYSYHFGCTFLELSYNKPIRVTDAIVVKPPWCSFNANPEDVVIDMNAGASFGTGQHPTTRLSLQGLDFLFRKENIIKNRKNERVLDTGTGSGILIIAAIKLGMAAGVGLDLDPCALAEARENVLTNGLESRIRISHEPVEDIRTEFFLTIANLRLPSLDRLFSHLLNCTMQNGYILLSGIKVEELALFQNVTQKAGRVDAVWQANALGWSAVTFKKRSASEGCRSLF